MTAAAIAVAVIALLVIPFCLADIIRRGLNPPCAAEDTDESARHQRDAAAKFLAASRREGGE